jgi:hypothetical protein
MPTPIYLKTTQTHPRSPSAYRDMTTFTSAASLTFVTGTDTTPVEMLLSGGIMFISERVAAEVTISGVITFALRGFAATGRTARFRARLYKITTGGSNIETLIGQADTTTNLTTAPANYSASFTPAAPVTMAPGERFILRVVSIPVAGSYGASGTVTMAFGTTTVANAGSVTFTETVTFRVNGTILYARRVGTSGIGNFFDLSLTRNTTQDFTTAVVNTAAAATEIQWTRTAGGTLLEWISPRMKAPGWTVDSATLFTSVNYFACESDAAANCKLRLRVFRRTPTGTETLVATWDKATELGVCATFSQGTLSPATLAGTVSFAEDDRVVLRTYIIPADGLTMGGGHTCTMRYDDFDTATQDYKLTIFDAPEFKDDADPDADPAHIPDGLTTMGMGN